MKNQIKRIDNYIGIIYFRVNKYFLGKFCFKLVSQAFLAIFIAIAISFSTFMYNHITRIKTENDNYNNINIGENEIYINSLFGTPKVSEFTIDTKLKNNFYVLKDSVLRAVFDNEKLVAYFITITDNKRKILLKAHYQDNYVLGNVYYGNLTYTIDHALVRVTASGKETFYCEWYFLGGPGNYNYYTYSIMNYGSFKGKNEAQLINQAHKQSIKNDDYSELLSAKSIKNILKYRENACPNTFGIVDECYADKISIMMDENWDNVLGILNLQYRLNYR